MTPRQRLLCALRREIPDRLPVTTHHVMPAFLKSHLGSISAGEFFDRFGLDAIHWTVPHMPDTEAGEYPDPLQGQDRFPGEPARFVSGVARRVRGLLRGRAALNALSFRDAAPRVEYGDRGRRVHGLGPRAVDQAKDGHRRNRRVRHGAEVRRRGGQSGGRGRWVSVASCAATSAASTCSVNRAAGRTPAAWRAPKR